jgi:hypothetical protein
VLETVSAFVASAVGKAVTGTALAAMSVGGMHAAGIVELPDIPDQAKADEILDPEDESGDVDDDNVVVIEVPSDEESDVVDSETEESEESESEEAESEEGESDEAEDGDGPSDHALAMQAWSECVDAASEARDLEMESYDASELGPPGRFDPEAECGDRPINLAAANAGPPEGVPQGPPEGAGPPEGVPQGPPEGAGPPEGVPQGPPEGAGPPDHAGPKGGRP